MKTLTKTLEGIYDQILQRIDEREVPYVKVILHWLVLAMHPLHLKELAIVVTFDPATGNFNDNMSLTHLNDILGMCSSLVIGTENDTVMLAHASVSEYLLDKPRSFKCDEIVLSHAGTCHSIMAHCSLRYIQSMFDDFDFQRYSAQFWSNHYKLSIKENSLNNLVMTLFKTQDFLGYIGPILQTVSDLPFSAGKSPLSYEAAAYSGQISSFRTILKNGNVHAQGGEYGNALQAASYRGNMDIVKFLLEQGIDVNVQGGQFGNALQAAALIKWKPHAVVQLLLENGANVNARGGRYVECSQICRE